MKPISSIEIHLNKFKRIYLFWSVFLNCICCQLEKVFVWKMIEMAFFTDISRCGIVFFSVCNITSPNIFFSFYIYIYSSLRMVAFYLWRKNSIFRWMCRWCFLKILLRLWKFLGSFPCSNRTICLHFGKENRSFSLVSHLCIPVNLYIFISCIPVNFHVFISCKKYTILFRACVVMIY